MSVRSGQTITTEFTTRTFSTGAATNASSTPTGTLYVNGTSNAASVTVTNQATGQYKAAVTLPTLAVGDVVSLLITATVSGVTDTAKVWEDSKDIVIDSAGLVDANAVKVGPSGSGTTQTARDLGANLDAAVSTRSTYAGGDTAGTTTLLSRVDVAVSTRLAASGYTAPDNTSIASILSAVNSHTTSLTWVTNFLGGDKMIDTAVNPWAEVVKIAGTNTELIRKKLRDTSGANITATTSVIGSAKDA
jgi:hypothetical protein